MNTYTCRHCGGLLLSEKLDSCGCSAAATEGQIARRSAAACSRFSAARIEELMQARDHITEGDRDMVCKDEACDLVNWYADELDRVRTHYQTALYEISITALKSGHYPENVQVVAPPPQMPDSK